MIICVETSQRTKDQLDQLLELGRYRDYSEAVAVAISNQILLHTDGAGNGGHAKSAIPSTSALPPERVAILELFLSPGAVKPTKHIPMPSDSLSADDAVSVDRWIFGQHNKLLPVKATCRALGNLLRREGLVNEGIPLQRAASEIAAAAVVLGDRLQELDRTSHLHRDDSLAFAFPFSDSPNGDKSRLRYANQFVANLNKKGLLGGLPAELKLVSYDGSRQPRLLLTEPGWQFATMENPVLDATDTKFTQRFCKGEQKFLLGHIHANVPVEAFAFKTVMEGITQGANTPDKLDDALEELLPKRKEKPYTRAFLTTQRAGVVSRMVDLGVITRKRDGINVIYEIAQDSRAKSVVHK
jgi:hypothetical protein